MPRGSPACARLVRQLLRATAEQGIDPSQILHAAELPTTVITGAEARVSCERARRVWEAALRLTRDPALGVHAARRLPRGAFGTLEYAARSSATFGDALELIARFARAVPAAPLFEVHRTERSTTLVFHSPHAGNPELAGPASELAFSILLVLGRDAADPRLRPDQVTLRHARPAHADELLELFQAPILFGAVRDEMSFHDDCLGTPLRDADPELCALLTAQLRQDLDQEEAQSCTDSVRAAIRVALAQGRVSLPAIARQLGVSGRVLQKRLQAEGTSFRLMLDAAREDLARQYLTEPQLPLTEVAQRLGYSEVSAFHRAFRRWVGQSPGAYRRLAAARQQSHTAPGRGSGAQQLAAGAEHIHVAHDADQVTRRRVDHG